MLHLPLHPALFSKVLTVMEYLRFPFAAAAGAVRFITIIPAVAAMMTVLAGFSIVPALLVAGLVAAAVACLVGFPALRVKGLMLVVATLAFGEFVRLFFFNFDYQIAIGGIEVGPLGGEGFRQIRYFPANGWTTGDVALFIWVFVILIMAMLWWFSSDIRSPAWQETQPAPPPKSGR